MRILFIGCVLSSEVLLTKLINMKCEIVGVITKKKSSFNNDFRDLGKICKINNIDFIYTDNINDGCSKEYINMKAPDVIYCFGWSQIIGEEVLMIPEKGVIGFHPTQLPNNRGRHPIIWALVLGLEKTASTFFFMDQGADTGDILSQVEKICDAYSLDGYIDFELEPACLNVYPRNELIKRMGQAMTRIAPDVVILPHRGDIHSDHRIAFEVVMACTKVFRYPSIKRIMSMEILSETDFADPAEVFCADYFVDISDYLKKKIEIMRIYSSELGTHPFPRNENSIRASALLHGITAGVEYAEAFHIIKIIEPNYLICQEL